MTDARPEAELREQIAALERRAEELAAAARAADEFLSFVAHELKTPIASLEGYAFLLAREGAAIAPDTMRRCLEGISRNAARLVALTGELLDIGRARTGRLEVRCDAVDLAVLAREAAGAAGPPPIGVDAAGPVPARGDARRLLALVREMIADARERAAGGEPVRIAAEARGGEALVRVRDGARPVARAQLEKGFSGARRAELTDRAGDRGGLGLALGREVVARLGGRVFAESSAEGNALGFALPLASESRAG